MKSLFILGMVLLSANAFAGNEKGNGGGIHYCAGQKTQELYDIYEAQVRYNFDIKKSSLAVDEQVNKVIEKIKKANPYIGREFEKQITYLRNRHMIIRANVSLTPIGDAKILIVDKGCSYKQLANWDEISGNLIVSKDYFDRLDNLNKAALYAHEALYKVGRDLGLLPIETDGTTTSDTIRRMIGEIFSTSETLEQMWDVVDPQIKIDADNAKTAEENEIFYGIFNNLETAKNDCINGAEEYKNFLKTVKYDCSFTLKDYGNLLNHFRAANKTCVETLAASRAASRDHGSFSTSNAILLTMGVNNIESEVERILNNIDLQYDKVEDVISKCGKLK